MLELVQTYSRVEPTQVILGNVFKI